ncbi:MAG: DNA repair protein RecO [Candidatus Omnitrophica bacterium]|nr:DNA repair protein RecO [Candidatus Omnitrophota bacterium]
MAIHKTEAIVIDRKDFRETSYLLSLFTADFGKIHAQAKGAKRKIDKFGSNFVPLSYNKIVFYESINGSLNIISQADLLEHFNGIDKDIEKYTYASYFLELINATMGLGDINKEIFVLLKNFLNFLDKEDKIPHIVQIFEIKFLNLSGFKPRLDSCVHCNGQIFDYSRFSYVLGGILCEKCFGYELNAQKLMQGTIATLKHIEKIELKKLVGFKIVPSVFMELKKILRTFIDYHITGEFKSLEFLKKIRYSYV